MEGGKVEREQLEAELIVREGRASLCEGFARWSGYLLTFLAILASFIAFVIGSSPNAQAGCVAVIAAISGFFTTINTTFNFNGRADWFCRRKNAYRRLLRTLKYTGGQQPDIAALARAISVLQESSAADFPRPELIAFNPATSPSHP